MKNLKNKLLYLFAPLVIMSACTKEQEQTATNTSTTQTVDDGFQKRVQQITDVFIEHLQKRKAHAKSGDNPLYINGEDSVRTILEIWANVDIAMPMMIREDMYEKDYTLEILPDADGHVNYDELLTEYLELKEQIMADIIAEEATVDAITVQQDYESNLGKSSSFKRFRFKAAGRKGPITISPIPKTFTQGYIWRGKDTIKLLNGYLTPFTTDQAPEMLTKYANHNLNILGRASSSNYPYKTIYLSILDPLNNITTYHEFLPLGVRSMYDPNHRDASYMPGGISSTDKYFPGRVWGILYRANSSINITIPTAMMNYNLSSISTIAINHDHRPLGSIITQYKILPALGDICGLSVDKDPLGRVYCWKEMHKLHVYYKRQTVVYAPNIFQ